MIKTVVIPSAKIGSALARKQGSTQDDRAVFVRALMADVRNRSETLSGLPILSHA